MGGNFTRRRFKGVVVLTKKQLKIVIKAYKILDKGWNKPCKEPSLYCPNCQHHIMMGVLGDHISTAMHFAKEELEDREKSIKKRHKKRR